MDWAVPIPVYLFFLSPSYHCLLSPSDHCIFFPADQGISPSDHCLLSPSDHRLLSPSDHCLFFPFYNFPLSPSDYFLLIITSPSPPLSSASSSYHCLSPSDHFPPLPSDQCLSPRLLLPTRVSRQLPCQYTLRPETQHLNTSLIQHAVISGLWTNLVPIRSVTFFLKIVSYGQIRASRYTLMN